jgi:serine/threonine protein kinase
MEWFVSRKKQNLLLIFIYLFSMDGGELFNRIRDRQDKPFTEREAANIILMIAKAVAHLHHMDMVNKNLTFFFVFRFDLFTFYRLIVILNQKIYFLQVLLIMLYLN